MSCSLHAWWLSLCPVLPWPVSVLALPVTGLPLSCPALAYWIRECHARRQETSASPRAPPAGHDGNMPCTLDCQTYSSLFNYRQTTWLGYSIQLPHFNCLLGYSSPLLPVSALTLCFLFLNQPSPACFWTSPLLPVSGLALSCLFLD